MTDTTNFIAEESAVSVEMIGDVATEEIDQKELAERLLAEAREQGVSLVGPGRASVQPDQDGAGDGAGGSYF